METSTDGAPVVPPLPVLSVLLFVFGSISAGVAVALLSKSPEAVMLAVVLLARCVSVRAGVAVAVLSNAPGALIVAVTLMVVLAPEAREAIVPGRAAQPLPLTLVMVRFVGVSVTWMFVAVDGPAFATTSV